MIKSNHVVDHLVLANQKVIEATELIGSLFDKVCESVDDNELDARADIILSNIE